MKAGTIAALATILSTWLSLAAGNAGAQSCEKSPCRARDTYDVRQRRCESGPNFLGYRSHYPPTCGDGYDLDPERGVCIKRGECCEKPACKRGYDWDARDRRCESDPTVLGYRSHYTPVCEAGWELDPGTGLCRKVNCNGPPGGRGNRPDLEIQAFGLREWGTCRPGRTVFAFQVTVANVGAGPSPEVLVQAKDQDGTNWGNGTTVGPMEPGRSRTVTIAIAYLRAAPDHMTAAAPHPFKAVVDPFDRVEEADERNNESAVLNIGAPRGCR